MNPARDCFGKFYGERINAEAVPAIPASIARSLLMDPRRSPLVLVWVSPDAPYLAAYLVVLSGDPQRPDGGVVIAGLGQPAVTASVVMATRRQGGTLCTWRCPNACGRTRSLFCFGISYGRPGLAIGCMDCLGLSYQCQGGAATSKAFLRRLIGIESGSPLPRWLQNPNVVTGNPERDLKRFKNITLDLAEPRRGHVEDGDHRVNGQGPVAADGKAKAGPSLPQARPAGETACPQLERNEAPTTAT